MKRRDLEKAKSAILEARDKMDREARDKRKVPWWRHFARCNGWPMPEINWIDHWEKRHEMALQRATHRALIAMKIKGRVDNARAKIIKARGENGNI